MRPVTPYAMITIFLFLAACNGRMNHQEASYAPTTAADSVASSITSLNDVSRKWIRTADIQCRVDNVLKTTTQLEQLVSRLNGIIVESRLENEAIQVKEFNYRTDSLKKVQLYVPTAYLTLKMPVHYLDTVVYTLSNAASFIHHRTLKQEDITLQHLANSLKNEALSPVKEPGKKLEQVQYNDGKKERSIAREIENLQLLDNVAYATLTVQLFQPQLTDTSVQVDPQSATRADFGVQLAQAMQKGLELFRWILLFFVQLWPLWVIAIILFLGYKKWLKAEKTVPQLK